MGMLNKAAATGMAPPAEQAPDPTESPTEETSAAPGAQASDPAAPDSASEGTESGESADEAQEPQSSGEQATPEEQAAYEKAYQALNTIVYGNDGTSSAIADGLQPEDKIGSLVKTSLMVIKSLDDKIQLDTSCVAQISEDTVGMLADMMERVKKAPLSDQEYQQAMGATWEGVMELFGVTGQEFDDFAKGEPPEATQKAGQLISGLKQPSQQPAQQPAAPAQAAAAPPAGMPSNG